MRTLPSGYRPYTRSGRTYYFAGGVWYEPGPLGFVVVGAPIGLYISVLPPYYTTVWLAGIPYYYANGTYYRWVPDTSSYVVVAPPPASEQPGPAPTAPSQDNGLYIYPKNGQSKAQQSADRFDCYQWAKDQTGFDPVQPSASASPHQSADYNRAMTACLEARGYSVR